MRYLLVLLALVSCAGEPKFRYNDKVNVKELPRSAIFNNCLTTGKVKLLSILSGTFNNFYMVLLDGCNYIDHFKESDLELRK